MVVRMVLLLKNTSSACATVVSDSVTGLVVFILFINDYDTDAVCLSSIKLKLFADNLELCGFGKVENLSLSSVSLKRSPDNICVWANEWKFGLMSAKLTFLP
jgi:hypothetical protein